MLFVMRDFLQEKVRAAGDQEKRRTEHIPSKYFRYGSEYHQIDKFVQPPKDKKKRQNKVRFSERGNRELQKECKNGDNDNDQRKYSSMAQMSGNEKSPSRDFGDSSQLTN